MTYYGLQMAEAIDLLIVGLAALILSFREIRLRRTPQDEWRFPLLTIVMLLGVDCGAILLCLANNWHPLGLV